MRTAAPCPKDFAAYSALTLTAPGREVGWAANGDMLVPCSVGATAGAGAVGGAGAGAGTMAGAGLVGGAGALAGTSVQEDVHGGGGGGIDGVAGQVRAQGSGQQANPSASLDQAPGHGNGPEGVSVEKGGCTGTAVGVLRVTVVQPPTKRAIPTKDFKNGLRGKTLLTC